jgi:hypothetical protein
MRVLIVGEGAHELDGALPTLVNRLLDTELEYDTDLVKRDKIHVHHGKGRGYFKKAVRWVFEARKRGYDAVVLVIDEDGQTERVRQIQDAQEYSGIDFKRALGVAIRTFDAWMLADETAVSRVVGSTVQRVQRPERIRNPKARASELLAACPERKTLAEMYASIAVAADIQALEERCPKGFGLFAERVRLLTGNDRGE